MRISEKKGDLVVFEKNELYEQLKRDGLIGSRDFWIGVFLSEHASKWTAKQRTKSVTITSLDTKYVAEVINSIYYAKKRHPKLTKVHIRNVWEFTIGFCVSLDTRWVCLDYLVMEKRDEYQGYEIEKLFNLLCDRGVFNCGLF